MGTPGFTAEFSASGHYIAMRTRGAPWSSAALVPQQLEAIDSGAAFELPTAGAAAIGCVTLLDRSLGPASIRLRCCAFPPKCCIRLCAFGRCVEPCVP